jgi:hypothetical protein
MIVVTPVWACLEEVGTNGTGFADCHTEPNWDTSNSDCSQGAGIRRGRRIQFTLKEAPKHPRCAVVLALALEI